MGIPHCVSTDHHFTADGCTASADRHVDRPTHPIGIAGYQPRHSERAAAFIEKEARRLLQLNIVFPCPNSQFDNATLALPKPGPDEFRMAHD